MHSEQNLTAAAAAEKQPTVDLWGLAEESEKKSGLLRHLEKTLVIVGEKGSGKSTFVNLLKNQVASSDRKELMHSYEAGGGKDALQCAVLPLSKENFREAFYAVIVDLSKPHSIIDNLVFWLEEVRRQVGRFFDAALISPDEQEQRANYEFLVSARFDAHPDRSRIKPMPIHTMIIGTKYDAFEKMDAEHRKWIARTLRFISHTNGASLFFTSCKNEDLFQSTRTTIQHVLFGKTLAQFLQPEHMKPIQISSGKDELAKMGLPQAPATMSPIDAFRKVIAESFPKEDNAEKSAQSRDIIIYIDKFPEARLDSIRSEKSTEMLAMSKQFMAFFVDNINAEQTNKKKSLFDMDDQELFETSSSHMPDQDHQIGSTNTKNFSRQEYNDNDQNTHITRNNQNPRQQNGSNNQNHNDDHQIQQQPQQLQQPRVNPYAKQRTNAPPLQAQRTNKTQELGGLPQI